MKRIVFSKHHPSDHCGVAYFAAKLARLVNGQHVQSFHGFRECDEFFINMDIFELNEADLASLMKFIESGAVRRSVLLMHDYRFSYLEDELVRACDLVIGLSGESALSKVADGKYVELFAPTLTDEPVLHLTKAGDRPLSLAFGFFSARKKSFKDYVSFYDYMLTNFPEWHHIIAASAHEGQNASDANTLLRQLGSEAVTVAEFLPGPLLAELIAVADLGVCFYPTGIMVNNATPMSFFSQGKTVVTNLGNLTPPQYADFVLDYARIESGGLPDMAEIRHRGTLARTYYEANLSWDRFLDRVFAALQQLVRPD